MKGHTAALFLLGGWLLMRPPERFDMEQGKAEILLHVPIERWVQERATDTAIECESLRKKLQAEQEKRVCEPHPRYKAETSREGYERIRLLTKYLCSQVKVSFDHALCVPADHVYPPRE